MLESVIACRPGCLSLPLAEAMKKLRRLGIRRVEVSPPEGGNYEELANMASNAGVTISSLGTSVRTDNPDQVSALERVIQGAAQIGTRIIFLSASHGDATYEEGIEVLRELADKARRDDVILSIETHPPFGHNGEMARKTIEAVGSDGLGFNFDTANIYYYNPKGVDTVEELQKVLPFVTSVHLKESGKGEPESFDFPALGAGIVDFPKVFELLQERGFDGPYTLELEGPLVHGLPVDEQAEKVKACLDYLRQIGVTV